jgi:hypothetical protein
VEKTKPKEGKNGGRYMVWKLSDLTKVTKASGKQPLQETSMFLFGAAYNDFWREDVGAVFGIRDASVREEVGARVPPPSRGSETTKSLGNFESEFWLGRSARSRGGSNACSAERRNLGCLAAAFRSVGRRFRDPDDPPS